MSSLATSLVFILLATHVLSMYIIHNGKDIRMVGPNSNCGKGRVEFYDGSSWGPFADCSSSSVATSTLFLSAICDTLGWAYYTDYFIGQDSYLLSHPETTTNYWLTNYTAYVYNEFDSCSDSSCSYYSDDICSECSFEYDSSLCSVSKYASDQSSIIDNYAVYGECTYYTYTTSSLSYYCVNYNTYADFDAANTFTDWEDCDYSYSSSSCYSYSLSAYVGAIVGWAVFICVIICCCAFCCSCQRRRFRTYGYYGFGTRRYGGTYGWFGSRGVTPAFAAGYNAGAVRTNPQVNTTTTTNTTVVVQQRMPVMMQQPIQGQVQYIQQPVQGQQVQYIQQPMQGQQVQYAQQTQMQVQQVVQPVQYQQATQGQQQMVVVGGTNSSGYPVLQAPPAYADIANEGI